MKYCGICKEEKELSYFYTNGKCNNKIKYKPNCKVCELKRNKKALNELIENFYGSWECKECKFKGHPAQYDCHHRDSINKDFQISRTPAKALNSKVKVIKELEKCDLLCSNCHRLKHVKY